MSVVGLAGEQPAHRPISIPVSDLIFRGHTVRGFWLNHWLSAHLPEEIAVTYRTLANLIADGTLSAPVEATYPLADYAEAIAHATREGRTGKVLFTSTGS